MPQPNRRVVRAPRVVAEHLALLRDDLRRFVQHHTFAEPLRPKPLRRRAHPRIAAAVDERRAFVQHETPVAHRRSAFVNHGFDVANRVAVETGDEIDVVAVVRERLDGVDRGRAGEVRVGHESRHRRHPSGAPAIEKRQLRVDTRRRPCSSPRACDANRHAFREDNVQDAVVGAGRRYAFPDRLLDLRFVDAACDRLGRRGDEQAHVVARDAAAGDVVLRHGVAVGAGRVDDEQQVRGGLSGGAAAAQNCHGRTNRQHAAERRRRE